MVFYRPPGSIPGDGLLGSALSPRPPHGHGPTPRPKAAAMAAQPAELLLVQVSSSHRFQACFAPACEARPRGCGRAAAAWGLPQDSTGSRWRMPLAGWPAFSSEHLLYHVCYSKFQFWRLDSLELNFRTFPTLETKQAWRCQISGCDSKSTHLRIQCEYSVFRRIKTVLV